MKKKIENKLVSTDIKLILAHVWNDRLKIFVGALALSIMLGLMNLTNPGKTYSNLDVAFLRPPSCVDNWLPATFQFEKMFFSEEHFINWKSKTPSATIEFADVEDSTIQKSVIFLKPLQKHMYLYDTQANLLYDRALITFWANKQTEVDAFFSYVDYLKKKMLEEYHIGALDKLASLYETQQNLDSQSETIVRCIISQQSFITRLRHVDLIFKLKPEGKIKSTDMKVLDLLFLSLFLSLGTGVLLSVIKFALRKS